MEGAGLASNRRDEVCPGEWVTRRWRACHLIVTHCVDDARREVQFLRRFQGRCHPMDHGVTLG